MQRKLHWAVRFTGITLASKHTWHRTHSVHSEPLCGSKTTPVLCGVASAVDKLTPGEPPTHRGSANATCTAQQQIARLPLRGTAPVRSVCAITSLHWSLLCCKAGRQAKQLQFSPGSTDNNGQAHVGKVRNATFAYFVILCPNIFTCNLLVDHVSSDFTHAWDYISHSLDLKWLLVAVSSQWLLWGLLFCGLSVVAEPVAWSSPEEAPLCWMDVCEASPDCEYWWRRW